MVAPLISAATMARLAALDERAMPSTCRVLRRPEIVSGGRVTYGDEAQAGATFDCRLATGGQSRELAALGRRGDESAATVATPLGTDVHGGDRIEVTTGGEVRTFEVIGDPVRGSYSTNLTITVQRES